MWFKAVIYFLLAYVMAACAVKAEYPAPAKPILTMHGETSFSKEDRARIEKAAKTWEKQTGGQAGIEIVWDYDQSKKAGNWHTIISRPEDDDKVVEADCDFSAMAGLPPGFCMPMVLAWVGPEDAGGIGIKNLEGEPVTLNLIPSRYESEERWQSVLIHEMGHIFGLSHNKGDQHAVMYPSNDPRKVCLTQADLHEFCSVNVCDDRKMYPCN